MPVSRGWVTTPRNTEGKNHGFHGLHRVRNGCGLGRVERLLSPPPAQWVTLGVVKNPQGSENTPQFGSRGCRVETISAHLAFLAAIN
jgi:hypothetical protein